MDKSFYDIGSADELKELWDSDLDPVSARSHFFQIIELSDIYRRLVIMYLWILRIESLFSG